MRKFSIGATRNNIDDSTVVVIGNDVIRLNSLLAATGNEVLPRGFGLFEMLDQWDVWFPRLKSVVDAFDGDVSIRNACDIGAFSEVNCLLLHPTDRVARTEFECSANKL